MPSSSVGDFDRLKTTNMGHLRDIRVRGGQRMSTYISNPEFSTKPVLTWAAHWVQSVYKFRVSNKIKRFHS